VWQCVPEDMVCYSNLKDVTCTNQFQETQRTSGGLPCGWEQKGLIFGLGNGSSNPRCERKRKHEVELHDCEGVLEMTESSDNIANKYSFDKNIIGTQNP